eukprot:scaffold374432_cov46-Prasinocladus_malaysianus.AAC.1
MQGNLGRAHHAYLNHMLDNYDALNPVTAFLKGGKGFSERLFRALGEQTGFWHMGCETKTCGKKGPFKAGAANQLRSDITKAIEALSFNTTLFKGYTKFKSEFAASREHIRSVPKQTLQYLKNYVLDPDQASCNDAGGCCHCEALERLWGHVLGCGDELFKIRKVLQEYRPTKWNPVVPRSCYQGHEGPIMLLQAQDHQHNIPIHHTRATMLSALYLAALLRWK